MAEYIDKLYETVLKLKTKEDCKMFFEDLCTYRELEQMAQRVHSAELLMRNNTYSQVIAATNISSATLSRVSRCVRKGTGGYTKFIEAGSNIIEKSFDNPEIVKN